MGAPGYLIHPLAIPPPLLLTNSSRGVAPRPTTTAARRLTIMPDLHLITGDPRPIIEDLRPIIGALRLIIEALRPTTIPISILSPVGRRLPITRHLSAISPVEVEEAIPSRGLHRRAPNRLCPMGMARRCLPTPRCPDLRPG